MEILNFSILIALVFLNLYWILYKSYYNTKGQNLATKEDIEEITQKIENVKLQLQYSQSQKKELLEQNKAVIINFYDNFIDWNTYNLNYISVSINDLHDPDSIRNMINILNLKQSKVQRSYWRLCLFEVVNKSLIDAISKIYDEADNLHRINYNFLLDMEHLSVSFKVQDKGVFSGKLNQEFGAINTKYETTTEELVIPNLGLPNKLMNAIRNRYLELYQ